MGGLRSSRALLILVLGLAAVAAVTGLIGMLFGMRGFAFAWTVHFALMAWMAALLSAAQPRLLSPWFRVRSWEPALYRKLGVLHYMRLLRWIGWEKLMRRNRSFQGTRATLTGFDRDTRMSELGHIILAGIGALLVAVAVALRAWDAVAWLSTLDIILHVYPVLLQRAMRARIQRLHAAATRLTA